MLPRPNGGEATAPAIHAAPSARTEAQPSVVGGAGGSSRVLMIDNNAGDIDLVAIACAELGQRIHWQRALDGVDGRAALERICDGLAPPCDLVILDLNMPRMGGLELLAWIRAQASFADVPVVVLTSSHSPRDRQRCLEAGADEVLLKPMIYEAYLQMAERLRPYLPGRD